jgi:hypothetical protein
VLAVQRSIADVLRWSHWRRWHQAVAKATHDRRRIQAIAPGPGAVQERSIHHTYPTDLTDSLWI